MTNRREREQCKMTNFKRELANCIVAAIEAGYGLKLGAGELTIETPPDGMGDLAFPCFKLAKSIRSAPAAIAQTIAQKICLPPFIESVATEGAYINFAYKPDVFVGAVLKRIDDEGEDYGRSYIGEGKNVVIDYSSPNIAKSFHIGHFRATIIGAALYNIMNYVGYRSVGINHLGDWGTQFGKLIVAYKLWGDKAEIEDKGISELQRIYVLYHEAAEREPSMDDDARAWMLKMQEGDEEALGLWRWFVDVSMVEFGRIYKMLGVRFDHIMGESFYNDKVSGAVEELRTKGLLVESEGAMIVELEHHGLAPCLILRKDGGTLYHTRDIAAALYRHKTFNFAKMLYVTAMDQSLHFAQLFKVLEEMGYGLDMNHVPFGLVSLETGKLATRKGNVVLMEQLLEEAVSRTLDIIEDKNPTLENKEVVAQQIGIGALVFGDLYNSRIKDTVFSWERVLSFEGESGPYVQYTHCRACSILAKVDITNGTAPIDTSLLSDVASMQLTKTVEAFAERIREASYKYEPYIVARYLVDLAQSFNAFYQSNPILVDDAALRSSRLSLVSATKQVLCAGLGLLGIAAPEKM